MHACREQGGNIKRRSEDRLYEEYQYYLGSKSISRKIHMLTMTRVKMAR